MSKFASNVKHLPANTKIKSQEYKPLTFYFFTKSLFKSAATSRQ